jgi:hypothetical protein
VDFAERPMLSVVIGAFAMKNRSTIAAVQQLCDDIPSALIANIQHKCFLLPAIPAFSWT